MTQDQKKIFTFYSYKGGVGRSMALANIAELLYRQNKRIVMVDWDLEAPGLEGYFYDTKSELESVTAQLGLIDMLESYKNMFPRLSPAFLSSQNQFSSNSGAILEKTIKKLLTITAQMPAEQTTEVKKMLEEQQEYIIDDDLVERICEELNKYFSKEMFDSLTFFELLKKMLKKKPVTSSLDKVTWLSDNLPSVQPLLHPIRKNLDANSRAGLWLLSAGKRNAENFSAYAKKVQDFDWADFYENYDGENYFNWLRKELKDFADIILIDSRTGVTEMGGICTRQLSDSVVLFSPPNAQNISGISEMVKSLKASNVEKMRGRALDVIVIPSRIDVSELIEQNNFQAEFLRQIGDIIGKKNAADFWDLRIPYIPYYTYHEDLVAGASMLTSDNLKNSRKSADLEKAYLLIASFMLEDKFEPLPEKEAVNPYIGLRPFEESDSGFFYGRSLEISSIIDTVINNKFLIVAGPTGSGKTSTLQAGVIPAFKLNRHDEKLRIVMLRPGNNIFYNMAHAILDELGTQNQSLNLNIQPKELADSIESQDHKYTEGLEKFFAATEMSFLLIIDQVEEIFTMNYEKTMKVFIATIVRWKQMNPRLSVILSTRSDFLQQLTMQFSALETMLPPVINLGVLDRKELRQSIMEPAAKAGLSFEEGLVERILKDSEKMFLKLPLIQNVLQELWLKRSGNIITHQAYNELGQMDGIMQDIIDKNLRRVSANELELAKPVVTRLIDVQTNKRRAIKLTDIDNADFIKLKPFINIGLVTVNFNKQTSTENIEFTSDFVFTEWNDFNGWIKHDYDFLKWRQLLDIGLTEWEKGERDMLNPAALQIAQSWLEKYPGWLTNKEVHFIETCREEKFAELQKMKIKKRKSIVVSSGVWILSFLIVLFFIIYFLRVYNDNKNLSKFKDALAQLNLKSGADKQEAICELATFNNNGNNAFISKSKDSLLSLCLNTQQVIDSIDSKISSLYDTAYKSKETISQSQAVDSLELKLNIVNDKIINAKNIKQKQDLQKDSVQVTRSIDSVVNSDSLLKHARQQSNKIEQAIVTQQKLLSKNDEAIYKQSTWFKKQYFLQFQNIKVLLVNLSKSNQSITVQICDMTGSGSCTHPIATTEIMLNQVYSFTYNDFKYTIQLDRIGSAGNNPFTPAAYITFLKYAK